MLNDLTHPENLHHCEFRDRRDMVSVCHYMWKRFFWHLRPGVPRVDLAVWEIGETVSVRPACTALDESSDGFVRPHPHFFEVRGYRQDRRMIEKRKDATPGEIAAGLQALQAELHERLQRAILQAFNIPSTKTAFRKYNPDDLPFTALMTTSDEGLHASEFQVIWKNKRGPTRATVRRRAAAAKGKTLRTRERGASRLQKHREKVTQKRKKEQEAAKRYWAREKVQAEKRKPAVRRKFAQYIEQALSKRPRSTGKRGPSGSTARGFPLSLDHGNQHDLRIVPEVTLDKLVAIHVGYKWSNFDEYDNRVWEYSYTLLDPVIQKARATDIEALWRSLNREQKVFFTFLKFVGQVDNGGVWQFLFNAPELSLAALEMMQEIGAAKLANDYQRTIGELIGTVDTVRNLRQRYADKELTSAKRWQVFTEGYGALHSTATIEKYFYTARFKSSLFRKMSDYVESSFHVLARVTNRD